MKKSILSIVVLVAVLLSHQTEAQVEKGKFLLGAKSDFSAYFKNTKEENTIDGNTTEKDGPTINQFGLTPTVGYFLVDGFAAGLFLDMDLSNLKREEVMEDGSTESLKSKNTSLLAGPFIRYYLDMEKVKPFAQVKIGWGSSNLVYDRIDYDYSDPFNPKYVIVEDELKYARSVWGIGAGAAIFVTGNVSVDIMIGYDNSTTKRKYEDSDNENIDRTGGFGLSVGFSIIIP